MFSSRTLKITAQIFLYSVILIVPYLVTYSLFFPYVSGKAYVFRMLVILAFFFWVWLILKDKEYKPRFKNILVISLILFFLAQVFVSFFSVDPVLSFFSSLERGEGVIQYGFWILYFLMLISLFKEKKDWKLFFSFFVVTAFLQSVYSLMHLKEQVRVYGFFGNPSYLAAFLLFAVGFCAIMIERKFFKEKLVNYLFGLLALFFVFVLILTQTRGAYFGLGGGIFLFCLLALLFSKKENKKLAIVCFVVLLIGFFSVLGLFLARETSFVQNHYILKRTASIFKLWQEDVLRERVLTWIIALKGFKERPIFGWGPEKFESVFNKFYDYRIGRFQPWFDRTHNYPLEILSAGGIFLFVFYLFWVSSVIYLIFKTSKRQKIFSYILISIFVAYFLQGLFLFDLLPVYLGLFPFLAFVVFNFNSYFREEEISLKQKKNYSKKNLYILGFCFIFSVFLIYKTVFLPYQANAFVLKYKAYLDNNLYKEAKIFLEKAYSINSPYTFWPVRKRSAWELVAFLEYEVKEDISPEDINLLSQLYDFISPELERYYKKKPYDPQIYYIAGRFYYLGYLKLAKNDLEKAEKILRKSFDYSDKRVEYFNEMAKILVAQGKVEEGRKLIEEHLKKIRVDETFLNLIMGNLYFSGEDYERAMQYYEKARLLGYKFYESEADYARYMLAAEGVKDYQKILDMALSYLEIHGPDADTYFNIALGYLNTGEKEKAKEFLLKSIELNNDYKEYLPYFENF